jgi:hypothetical protein
MALAPVSITYRTIFIQPHIALNNTMACRVFRGIRLGSIQEVDGTTQLTKNSTIIRLSHPRIPSGLAHGFNDSHVTGEIVEGTEDIVYPGKYPVRLGGHNHNGGRSEVTLDQV